MPSQIKQLAPWFKYCTDSFFTALDPPRALNPVSDLGPSDPKTPASVPVPSPTRTLLAEHSDHGASPSPTPAISAIVDQPKATSNPAVDPTTESSNADPLSNDRGSQLFPPSLRPTLTTASEDANHGDDTNQGSNANQNNDFNQSNDPNQSSDSKQNNDTNQGSNPNQNNDPKENNDPNQGSDPSNGEDPSEGGNHNQVSDPGQGSTVTGDSGLGEKSSQPSLPLQTGSADQGPAGSDQIVDSGNTVPANGGLGHDPTGASPPKSSSPESGSKAAAPLLVVPNPLTTPTEGSTLTEGQVASINNQQVQQLSQGISIAGTTLTPGAPPITVASTLISFGSAALVVGTSTVPFASETPRKIVTTIAGQVLTVAPTAITFAGTTLSPGVAGAGVDGTIVSLDSAGQFIVGSQKIPLLSSSLSRTITTTIAGQPITAAPNAVAIAGSTLTAGASGTTLSGTPVSLNAAGQLVVGSKTVPLDSDSESSRTITTTIGDRQVITAAPTGVAFAGTTLRPGASGVTINDTLVSLNTAGQLVLGSTTVTLQSKDTGLGGLIIGGFGPGGPVVDPTSSVQRNVSSGFGNGTGAGGPVFEGKAGGLRWCLWWEKVVLPMLATVIMMCIY